MAWRPQASSEVSLPAPFQPAPQQMPLPFQPSQSAHPMLKPSAGVFNDIAQGGMGNFRNPFQRSQEGMPPRANLPLPFQNQQSQSPINNPGISMQPPAPTINPASQGPVSDSGDFKPIGVEPGKSEIPSIFSKNFLQDFHNDISKIAPIELQQAMQIPKQEPQLQSDYMQIAQQYLGMNEKKDQKALSNFFSKSLGQNLDPASTAWCAGFANSVLKASGREGTGSLMAKSFLKYGEPVTDPSAGDIVVLNRGSDPRFGHVGFYQGEVVKNGVKYIKVLGGNQGDSVSERLYPANRLAGYRHPPSPP